MFEASTHIQNEIVIDAAPEAVWDAVRDVGNLHTRLVPGIVSATRLEDDARIVTFANGARVRERIIGVDEQARRLVWAIEGEIGAIQVIHHQGSLQVFPLSPSRSRLVWHTDILPAVLLEMVRPTIENGMQVMQRTLEAKVASLPLV